MSDANIEGILRDTGQIRDFTTEGYREVNAAIADGVDVRRTFELAYNKMYEALALLAGAGLGTPTSPKLESMDGHAATAVERFTSAGQALAPLAEDTAHNILPEALDNLRAARSNIEPESGRVTAGLQDKAAAMIIALSNAMAQHEEFQLGLGGTLEHLQVSAAHAIGANAGVGDYEEFIQGR